MSGINLTILGCHAPFPKGGGACPGYLFQCETLDKASGEETEGGAQLTDSTLGCGATEGCRVVASHGVPAGRGVTNLLIDCGHGAAGQLLKYINHRDLHHVVLTHLHADHSFDAHCLRYAVRGSFVEGTRTEPLTIYAPHEPEELFEAQAYEGYVRVEPIRPEEELSIGPFRLKFIKTIHPILCYAVSVECCGRRIVYSADSEANMELERLAASADLFLCEASFLETGGKGPNPGGHLSARGAGELARRAGARRLILTHLWPEFAHDVIRREGEEGFGGTVEVAEEGMTIIV